MALSQNVLGKYIPINQEKYHIGHPRKTINLRFKIVCLYLFQNIIKLYKTNELTEFWSLSHNITYNINENGIIPTLYPEIGLQMFERSYRPSKKNNKP